METSVMLFIVRDLSFYSSILLVDHRSHVHPVKVPRFI